MTIKSILPFSPHTQYTGYARKSGCEKEKKEFFYDTWYDVMA